MKTVTMLEFRRNASAVLKRLARGERLVLSHRGKPVLRLEPIQAAASEPAANDPFFTIGARAKPSPRGQTRHEDIDAILYGRR